MPDPTLARHAGPIALVAGGVLAATDLGRLPVTYADDRTQALLDPLLRTVNAAYFVAFVGLALALVALHGRQAGRAGRFGVAAFCVALFGTMTQGGNMWFDGFAAPWLAEVAPQVFTGEKTVILKIGALLACGGITLGWVLFAAAALRARTYPVVLPLALAVAAVVAFGSGVAPNGVPLGLAVAAMGAWLVHTDRSARRTAVAARA